MKLSRQSTRNRVRIFGWTWFIVYGTLSIGIVWLERWGQDGDISCMRWCLSAGLSPGVFMEVCEEETHHISH